MRGLFLDNLTGLVGDVFKGVANSTSRMKESVLFHNGEEEKKYKQMEETNKQIKAKEKELKTREEKAKEDDAKHQEEVGRLKGEVEETNKQGEETNKQEEETNKQIKAKEDEMKTREERANIRIDKLKKQLEYKDGIIRELRTHNAGLKVAFDLNAGVTMQMENLAAKEEAANLKAASLKRSRQELEATTGPAVKQVCLAVKQLGSKKQEVVANSLQVIDASAKIIGPAVFQSKNKKRREERGRSKKGNQYCCICKDFFRLDL